MNGDGAATLNGVKATPASGNRFCPDTNMRTHRLKEIFGIRSVLTQPLSFATLVFALATTCVLPAQTAGSGTITGRVSNAATSANLEGAIVRLDGTNFSAQTERDGTFRLQVPAGSYTLVASYTALDAQAFRLVSRRGRWCSETSG